MNHGIPTIYKGIEYRSRLEARWAAFFDGIGWRHTYEPFDGNGYIPDFLIHGQRPFLVEIKPAATKEQFEAPIPKIEAGLSGIWNSDVLILGADPQPDICCSDTHWPEVGMFGQWHGSWLDGFDPTTPAWNWAVGDWFACRDCHQLSVSHTTYYWMEAIPCGDSADDVSHSHEGPVEDGRIASYWAAACNEVKWHGKDAS